MNSEIEAVALSEEDEVTRLTCEALAKELYGKDAYVTVTRSSDGMFHATVHSGGQSFPLA